MTVWIDAQIALALAPWLMDRFAVRVHHVQALNLVPASDHEIFAAARSADVVILTKDRDFVDLVKRNGAPLRVIWITCGNTSNRELRRVLERIFAKACELLGSGEPLVEIRG